jgi:ribonuclease HI
VKEWMDATENGVLEQSIAKLKQSQEVNCYWVREHEGEKANHTLQEIC